MDLKQANTIYICFVGTARKCQTHKNKQPQNGTKYCARLSLFLQDVSFLNRFSDSSRIVELFSAKYFGKCNDAVDKELINGDNPGFVIYWSYSK